MSRLTPSSFNLADPGNLRGRKPPLKPTPATCQNLDLEDAAMKAAELRLNLRTRTLKAGATFKSKSRSLGRRRRPCDDNCREAQAECLCHRSRRYHCMQRGACKGACVGNPFRSE